MSASGDDLNGSCASPGAAAASDASGSTAAAVVAAPPAASADTTAPVTGDAPTDALGRADAAQAGTNAPEPLLTGIARLKAEQANLRAERKRVQKELKNAEKRRTRLKKRARQLSDGDLVAVLQMRETTPVPATTTAGAGDGSREATPLNSSATGSADA